MGTEQRHLRYVFAASRYGSSRRAAVSLRMEQAAISRDINDHENGIGAGYFIRRSSSVLLVQMSDTLDEFPNLAACRDGPYADKRLLRVDAAQLAIIAPEGSASARH